MKNINIIRRKVATTANRLKKLGYTLSNAFRKAWALIKGENITSKVSGTTKGNRQKALEHLTRYNPQAVAVRLEREPTNLYDRYAIKVIVSVNNSADYTLGYIPSNIAYIVSAIMDKGIDIKATFKAVRGKYTAYMNYGAVIDLQIGE